MSITLYKRVTKAATQTVSGDHLATTPANVSFDEVSPEELSQGTLYYCVSPDKNTWSNYKNIPASVTQLCLLSNTISNPDALIKGICALPKTIKKIHVLEGDGTELPQRKQLSQDDPYVMLLNYIISRKNQKSFSSFTRYETESLIKLLAHVTGSDPEKKMTSEQVHSAISCLDRAYGNGQHEGLRHQIEKLKDARDISLSFVTIPLGMALTLGPLLMINPLVVGIVLGSLVAATLIIGLSIALTSHMKAAGMEKVLQQVEQDKGNSSSTSLLLNAIQRANSLNSGDNDDNNPIPPSMRDKEVEPENGEDALPPQMQQVWRQGATHSFLGDRLGSQPEPSAPPVSMDDENFKLQ